MEKVINDLVGYDNLKIVQCKDYFNFSLESVLLPNFVRVNKSDKKVIDLGCGNAPIPLILNHLYPSLEIIGVEIQYEVFKLALSSLNINNISKDVKIINEDIKNLKKIFKSESFDIVISNPPYFKVRTNQKTNTEKIKSIARHEIKMDLNDLVETASFLLKNKAKFVMVHRTERLDEIIEVFRKYKIEPKRLQFIYSKKSSNSDLFLIEGVKNTGRGIKILKPLIIHNDDGSYSKEIKEIFKM